MRSALAGDGDVSPLSQSEVNITTPPSRLSALANSRPALRAWAVEPEQQGTAPIGGIGSEYFDASKLVPGPVPIDAVDI